MSALAWSGAVLALLLAGGLSYIGRPAIAVGVLAGYAVSWAYFHGLKRTVKALRAGGSVTGAKLTGALRLAVVAVSALVLGLFLPRGLWGFLGAFTLAFLVFIIDTVTSSGK